MCQINEKLNYTLEAPSSEDWQGSAPIRCFSILLGGSCRRTSGTFVIALGDNIRTSDPMDRHRWTLQRTSTHADF